ncbi:hypothetical protein Hanom_Chr00s000077g01619041 [Helianthus anomalus]
MIEKYHACKKELESTQITCEKWVESCKGYEVMLEKQIKSNIKFGVGFRKHDQIENIAVNCRIVRLTQMSRLEEFYLVSGVENKKQR